MAPLRSGTLAVMMCALVVGAVSAAEWHHVGRAAADVSVPVTLALRHGASMAQLESACMSRSDPESPLYGDYMSLDELTTFLGADSHLEVVQGWLAKYGVQGQTVATRDFVTFRAPVALVEAMFAVEMHEFDVTMLGASSPLRLLRSAAPHSLPAPVAAVTSLVLGVSDRYIPDRFEVSHDALNTAAKAAVQAAAAAAAAAATPLSASLDATPPSPPSMLGALVTADTLYVLLEGQLATDLSYVVTLTIDGFRTETVTFSASNGGVDAPHYLPLPGLTVLKTSKYMQAYSTYNVSVVAETAGGVKSQPAGLPIKWDQVPASYKGIVATPAISPAVYGQQYGLPGISTSAGATQAVAEFGGQYMNFSDFDTYMQRYELLSTEPKVTVVGPNDQSMPGIEPQMDIELIDGISPNASSTFWSVGDNGFILQWAMQMSNATNPPLVTSISYGGFEDDMIPERASRTNAEFLKLCTRGLSVVIASGDAGASGNGHGTFDCAIQPVFPASSPWVTAVSATQQSPLARTRLGGGIGEIPVSVDGGNFWTTGGGFSTFESCRQPSYQAKAVQHYFEVAKLPNAAFNKTGRGYPDVSSIGTNYWMTLYNYTFPLGAGTSAASPTFAGVLSLLNQERLAQGFPAIGFANPLLYSIAATSPDAFYDVTMGNNMCGEGVCCPEGGFEATEGWDPVTGLGSVGDYQSLLLAVLRAGAKN